MEEGNDKEKMHNLASAFELFIEVATLCKTRLQDILQEHDLTYEEWRILSFLASEKVNFWTATGQELFIKDEDLTEAAKNLEHHNLLLIKECKLTAEGRVIYWIVAEQFEKLAKSVFEFQEERQRKYFIDALNTIKQLIV